MWIDLQSFFNFYVVIQSSFRFISFASSEKVLSYLMSMLFPLTDLTPSLYGNYCCINILNILLILQHNETSVSLLEHWWITNGSYLQSHCFYFNFSIVNALQQKTYKFPIAKSNQYAIRCLWHMLYTVCSALENYDVIQVLVSHPCFLSGGE